MKTLIVFPLILFMVATVAFAKARAPNPVRTQENYSLTKGEIIPISAKKAVLPFIVYGEEPSQPTHFISAGHMGESQALSILSAHESAPLPSGAAGRTCLKVRYRPKGGEGWSGVYWLSSPNNWAKVKGGGYDLSQSKQLTFWVRGSKGGEKITEFKIGGLVGPYPDTDVAAIGPITLSKNWEQYAIDLQGKDLRHISGGFAFIIRQVDNFNGALFYLDEIRFEETPVTPFAVAQTTTSAPSDLASAPVPTETAPALIEPIRKVIPFPTGSASLPSTPKADLEEIISLAQKNQSAVVVVEGHTDNVGSASLNKKLSIERARFVADYLQTHGLENARIKIEGYGSERPLTPDSNKTKEGRQMNRRVEVTLMPS